MPGSDSNAAISPSVYTSAIGAAPSIDSFRDWAGWNTYFTNARRLPEYTIAYTGKQAVSPYSSTILKQDAYSTAAADSCAASCKVDPYCGAIEMSVERVPTTAPTTANPNPAAKFVVSCHLHNKRLAPADATFNGRSEQSFYRTQTAVTFFNRNDWKKTYPATYGQSCASASCGSGLACEATSKVCRIAANGFCAGPQDDSKCATGLCSFSSEVNWARCIAPRAKIVPQDRHCLVDADCNTANCVSDVKRCGPALATTTVTVTVAPATVTVTRNVTATTTVSVDADQRITQTVTTTRNNTITVPTTTYATAFTTSTSTEVDVSVTTQTVTSVAARRALATSYNGGTAQQKARAVSGPVVTVTTFAPVQTVFVNATRTVTVTLTRAPATTTATSTVFQNATVLTTVVVPTTVATTTTTTSVTQTTTTATVAPSPPARGIRIKLVKASDGSSLGYLGALDSQFGTQTIVTASSDAVSFTFNTPANNGLFSINAPTGSAFPYLGAVFGTDGNGKNLRDNSGDFLLTGYTASVPLGGQSTDTTQNSLNSHGLGNYYESQVWSLDSATAALSVTWSQPDGCECASRQERAGGSHVC